jgi:hypothetical protein
MRGSLRRYVNSMVDPPSLGAGALVKATDGAVETSKHLLVRLLGPPADVYGDFFAERASARVERRRKRLAERALAKAQDKSGAVNARVAVRIIQDASMTDNEILVEYLSGVLASSRTPDGQDDSGISWSSLLSTMSSVQIRAHFLLYREWAELLHEHGIDLSRDWARRNVSLWVEYGEFERALNIVRASSLLQHALTGLARNGLIEDHDWGPRTEAHLVNSPYDEVVVAVPSIAGFELYGWAQGRADMPLERFPFEAEVFDTDPSTPRLKTALLFESVMEIFRENERKQES